MAGCGMSAYLFAKHLHQGAVGVTVVLFLLRGTWMLARSPMLERRWVRVVPHVNDSLLLAAALYMTAQIGLQPWIVAKLVALAVYVVLGTLALRRGRTAALRAWAFAGALIVLAYILAVALTKSPWPPGG
jgi:uncharacterized membrane protein SirB2